jgi:hypothetical protein
MAGESMDDFALRIAPTAVSESMRLSNEMCGEFRRQGNVLALDLYSIRRLRHCSYRRLSAHDYTGLTFHTHVVIGETDPRRVRAKLMNPKFSAEDYSHPGYLASGRRVLFQSGPGTEKRVRAGSATGPEHRRGYGPRTPTEDSEMTDSSQNRGEPDRSRINVNQEHEVRYWTKALDVTEDELRAAVDAVGPVADKVRAYFQRG